MCIEACCDISPGIIEAYKVAMKTESSAAGRNILEQLIKNAEIASTEKIPVCQDTGMTVVFAEIGDEVIFDGDNITAAINEGVRKGYEYGFLRKSIVMHPTERKNTGDNTPAVIYYEIIKGDKVKLSVMPKGFGSENMSALKMLKPSDGIKGIIEFIIETIDKAGPNACPPLFVGVGIGGTADKAMLIAKKALLREPGVRSKIKADAEIERILIEKANKLGIGPAGLGGNNTVFDVFVESYPTHIAGLPVAVNICCHSMRHRECVI
jgi:fumarate hydratase subunit alpha